MEETQHTFTEISQRIADDFLSTIVFIDECAYKQAPENDNDFDAKTVTDAFAKKGKICSVFAPGKASDLDNICSMLFKADAIVLDWRLNIPDDKSQPSTDLETDSDSDDERGQYTIPLIQQIVKDAENGKVKLIVVYTGETNLNNIRQNLFDRIQSANKQQLNDRLEVKINNVKILVRAKYKEGKYSHSGDALKQFMVKYEELPDFIVNEFSSLTTGLLPNFALQAITEIRNSTSKILGVFSKDLDPAFLGHYVSIPDCNDAFSVLYKVFGTAIANLIGESDIPLSSWILAWVETIDKHEVKICNEDVRIDNENLKTLVESDKSFRTKIKESFSVDIKYNEYEKEETFKKDSIKFFAEDDFDNLNYQWAKLLQHNNLFFSPKRPRLTLGTIVKCKSDKNEGWKYLLCIQQRCDSVRIQSQEVRTFLFLPLVKGIKGEAVVVGENDHYIVDNKTYSIELHEFSPKGNEAFIAALSRENNEYIFQDKHGINYIWVAELNEMFAQSIVSAYASQLSRVGIDNSEWMRLIGKTK